MIQMMRALGATAVVVASCMGSPAVAQNKQLTLCWAAWVRPTRWWSFRKTSPPKPEFK